MGRKITAVEGKRFLSARETARYLGIGQVAVYAMLGDGRIPSIKVGKKYYVSVDALERCITAWVRKRGLSVA